MPCGNRKPLKAGQQLYTSAAKSEIAPKQRFTAHRLRAKARKAAPVVVVTCYDSAFATLVDEAVDMVLVGDSVANVCLGQESTRTVTMEAMLHHSAAVRTSLRSAMLVTDMPFGSYLTEEQALTNAAALMARGGADAVKLEGGESVSGTVRALTSRGIPVVGHVGLLPQTAGSSTGFRVQAKSLGAAQVLLRDCRALAEAGACAVVLELVPDEVAAAATALLRQFEVPTIGIGAGPHCGGQVLVLHDLLGLHTHSPRFAPSFADPPLAEQVASAVGDYASAVRSGEFPSHRESFPMPPAALAELRAAHPALLPAQSAPAEAQHVAVVGAGAMGSLLAARLRLAGHRVTVLSPRLHRQLRPDAGSDSAGSGAARAESAREASIAVRGPGSGEARVEVVGEWAPGPTAEGASGPGLVVVAVRNEAAQLERAARAVREVAAGRRASEKPMAVLMVQNGLGAAEALQLALGDCEAVVLDCVTSEGAALAARGAAGINVTATGGAGTTVGALPDSLRPRGIGAEAAGEAAGAVAALLAAAGIPATPAPPAELAAARLLKQGVSLSLVATAAVAGVRNGAVLESPALRAAMHAMALEAAPLLRAEAARAGLGGGAPAAALAEAGRSSASGWAGALQLFGGAGATDEEVGAAVAEQAEAVAAATAGNTCSMLAARQRGEAQEIEATLGWAVRAAERQGLPVNRIRHAYISIVSAAEALRR